MRLIVVTGEAARVGAPSLARIAARQRTRRDLTGLPAAELVTPARFKTVLPQLDGDDLVYLDLSALPSGQALVRLRRLLRSAGPMVGVVDPGGLVRDVPGLFHAGAVDYLDRTAVRRGLTARRLRTVIAWAKGRRVDAHRDGTGPVPQRQGLDLAKRLRGSAAADWSRIRPGREYTFSLGFVELDGAKELEQRYSAADLAEALASFRAWVERSVAPYGGRIWIWSRFGGVVVFPFNGRHEQASSCFLRMTLFWRVYDVEQSRFPNFTSCRFAIHLGDVVWRQRQTGTLVADALNTTFHLGRQFAPRGRCCMTEEVHRFAAPAVRALCSPAGEFEGRGIWLMRQPRSP